MNVLLGVDLGTSAFKAVAITPGGEVLAQGRVAAAYQRRAPDRVQFSAERQFGRICQLLRAVAADLPRGARPAALCLSGASGNTLLLDARHRPVAPAISWLDTRAGDTFETLLPSIARPDVLETVGWPWSRRFSLTQLAWLRRHRPGVYRKARYFAPDPAFYHHMLTGRFVIDHSSATNFFLQDQRRRRWHPPFLHALGIDESSLPELVAPGTRVGGLTRAAARLLGLPNGLPVIAGSFDHPSAALGAGVVATGDLLLSCGTSWVGFLPTRDRAAALASGLIVDPFLQPRGPWGAMFALTAVGTTIDRYLAEVFPFPAALPLALRYEQFSAAASTVPCNQEGTPIDPLGPVPDTPEARARLCAGASLGVLSRRLMVGTALAMRRRLATLTARGFEPKRLVMVGGPSTSRVWTQVVADVLGRELLVASASMAGASGAALLGGVGIGLFRGPSDAVRRARPPLATVSPDPAARACYAALE